MSLKQTRKILNDSYANKSVEMSEASRDRLSYLEKNEKNDIDKLDSKLSSVAKEVVAVEQIIDKSFIK